MVRIDSPQNYVGDSFWNSCHQIRDYMNAMDGIFKIMLRWTEPHLLVSCCLVILLLLPLIFLVRPDDTYVKISRLYNVSRLSVLTFFHRVVYIYLIFCPLGFLINQQPPCKASNANLSQYLMLFDFPSAKFASLSLTLLYLSSLAAAARSHYTWIFAIILLFSAIHFILCGDLSVVQSFTTLALSYICHFYSQRMPFWALHIENIVLPLLFIVLFIIKRDQLFKNTDALGRAITALSLWVADFYMLGRYQCTRSGFVSVGRPIDLEWETDTKSSTYFSVLSSEEEEVFSGNLQKDLVDSVVSMVIYVIGLIIRHCFTGIIRSSAIGLI